MRHNIITGSKPALLSLGLFAFVFLIAQSSANAWFLDEWDEWWGGEETSSTESTAVQPAASAPVLYPSAPPTGSTSMTTFQAAKTEPPVNIGRVERTVSVYDQNNTLIMSASASQGMDGNQTVTVFSMGKFAQPTLLPAMSKGPDLPSLPEDCESLEQCAAEGNKSCLEAFMAQGCRSADLRGGCRFILVMCLDEGGQYCVDYVENDCLGSSR